MSTSRTLTAYFIAAATAVSLATTAPAPADAGTTNACALVTAAEASSAMGVTSLPGKARATRHGTSCRYYSPDHKMNVFVQTVSGGDLIGAAQLGGKAIAGVGDKAIWATGSLFVQKGNNFAQIELYKSPASMEHMDPAVVALGKTAAGRM